MRDSDRLPEGEVTIAYEMHTPPERGVPAELKFWISGKNSHSKAGSIWLSHKNGLNRSVWYLARRFNYQGMHRIFILQLDIKGEFWIHADGAEVLK
jgi:hypothetical protein